MKLTKNKSSLIDQQGQAATEFIIASVFLLIPLFLIIPLLGKYIDIRHSAIQQARFEAWEYTVWQGPHESIMNDIQDAQSSGRRGYEETRKKGLGFFFSDPTSDSYGTPEAPFQPNPLWVDHQEVSLFPASAIISGEIVENKTPDGLRGVLSTILEAIKFVFEALGDIMKFVHVDAKFDALYTRGYYTSNVNVKIRSIADILPEYSLSQVQSSTTDNPLEIKAKASVLTNGWNAGSTENATAETRGMVFTALLKPISDTVNGIVSRINKLVKKIPGFTIQLPSVPDFGYVSDDLVPYEHLEENKKNLQNKYGLYYYE